MPAPRPPRRAAAASTSRAANRCSAWVRSSHHAALHDDDTHTNDQLGSLLMMGSNVPHPFVANAERLRLVADREGREHWRKWGPSLSDRQWGTVREDYSPTGDAWDFFPYSQA